MKIFQNDSLKAASIIAVLSLGMLSTSLVAQRGQRGDSRVDNRRGNNSQVDRRVTDRQNQKALRAADRYLDVLEQYYLWAQDRGHRGLVRSVKNLYDTVHNKIQKPLKRGRSYHQVKSKLGLVHQDVQKVRNAIKNRRLGRRAIEKFRSIDQKEKAALVRALNIRGRW